MLFCKTTILPACFYCGLSLSDETLVWVAIVLLDSQCGYKRIVRYSLPAFIYLVGYE